MGLKISSISLGDFLKCIIGGNFSGFVIIDLKQCLKLASELKIKLETVSDMKICFKSEGVYFLDASLEHSDLRYAISEARKEGFSEKTITNIEKRVFEREK